MLLRRRAAHSRDFAPTTHNGKKKFRITALCSAGEHDRVLEVWQRMAKEAAGGAEVRPNTETCNTVIAAAACVGDLDAACDAYNYILRHNLGVTVVRAEPMLLWGVSASARRYRGC